MNGETCDVASVNKELSCWCSKIQSWYDTVSASNTCRQADKQSMYDFLQVLRQALSTRESADEVLKTFPTVGQFLSRVVTLPVLMADRCVSEPVVACLLVLYTTSPATQIQHRANAWVMSQIRHLCTGSAPSVFRQVQDVTGSSTTEQAHRKLNIIADACSRSLLSPDCVQQMEDSISVNTSDSFSGLGGQLAAISDWDRKNAVSYKNQVSTWREEKAALEVEVLRLVSCFCNLVPGQESHLLEDKNFQNLVSVCAVHTDLYQAVFAMLRQLLTESASPCLVRLVNWLHQTISHQITHIDQVPEVTVVSLFPRSVQAIVQMLLVNPLDLTQSVCEHHVTQIDRVCTKTQIHSNPEDLKDVRLKFLTWKFTLVSLCIIGTNKVVDSALNVLLMFYNFSTPALKKEKSLVLHLKGLRFASSDAAIKVKNMHTDSDCQIAELTSQLWLLSLLVAESGDLWWRDVMTLISKVCRVPPSDQLLDFLMNIVDTLEVTQNLCPTWVRESVRMSRVTRVVGEIYTDMRQQRDQEGRQIQEQVIEKYTERLRHLGVDL